VGALWQYALLPRRVGADDRQLDAAQPHGRQAHTQKIERKPMHLRPRRKRLMRRTLCFSKPERMHDVGIGLLSNRYEFGVAV
jgi:insertion element IS1 protein InsB